jgi:hypothetical protein
MVYNFLFLKFISRGKVAMRQRAEKVNEVKTCQESNEVQEIKDEMILALNFASIQVSNRQSLL